MKERFRVEGLGGVSKPKELPVLFPGSPDYSYAAEEPKSLF